jgi:hypothetical protein
MTIRSQVEYSTGAGDLNMTETKSRNGLYQGFQMKVYFNR